MSWIFPIKGVSSLILEGSVQHIFPKYSSFCFFQFRYLPVVNSPPPTLCIEAGASALRLSFPAFPGDLFRDGCNHPPRSQTGYPRCSTGSVWLRCLEDIAFRQLFVFLFVQVLTENTERFLPDVDCRIFVPVHGRAALRADISPVG